MACPYRLSFYMDFVSDLRGMDALLGKIALAHFSIGSTLKGNRSICSRRNIWLVCQPGLLQIISF